MSKLATAPILVAGACGFFALGLAIQAPDIPAPEDWMTFAGAMIGASITVLGSVYVLDRERQRDRRERRALLLSLLDEADTACAPFQLANERALEARYGRSAQQQVRLVTAAVKRIKTFGERIEPTTASMMKVADLISDLPSEYDEMTKEAMLSGLYPESSDLGHLNTLAQEITTQTTNIRRLLG